MLKQRKKRSNIFRRFSSWMGKTEQKLNKNDEKRRRKQTNKKHFTDVIRQRKAIETLSIVLAIDFPEKAFEVIKA